MELSVEAELYSPSVNEIGNYIDFIPSSHCIKKGIRCPCGSRKDKIYDTTSVFSNHIKTKIHQKWLANLNANKANFYIENEHLKTTIQNQKMIIAKFEKECQNKIMTIDYLTKQLTAHNQSTKTENLLFFD